MQQSNLLTLSCLEISLTRAVWTLVTFENNFGITHKLTKYLKESYGLDWQIFCKQIIPYFLKDPFVREISPKYSQVVLGTTDMNGLKVSQARSFLTSSSTLTYDK